MDILNDILKDGQGGLLASLTEQAGLGADDAGRFLPLAVEKIGEVFSSGGLDLSALLGGDAVSSLLSKVDLAGLASSAGLAEGQARDGLSALAPSLLESVKDKAGEDGLASLLGGSGGGSDLLGAAGKLAGNLFK